MQSISIRTNGKKVPPETTEQFRELGTTIIGDAMGRFHTMTGMKPYHNAGVRLVGTAVTVRTVPGDNLMIHKAIELAEPGDVIVVDGGGNLNRALIGEMLCRIGQKKGVAGFVVDGAVRDVQALKELGFPVFAKGHCPAGPFREGSGQINHCISCSGVPVYYGDLIVGDEDGVAVIPRDQADSVLSEALKIAAYEEEVMRQIDEGTLDRKWIDQTLNGKGYTWL